MKDVGDRRLCLYNESNSDHEFEVMSKDGQLVITTDKLRATFNGFYLALIMESEFSGGKLTYKSHPVLITVLKSGELSPTYSMHIAKFYPKPDGSHSQGKSTMVLHRVITVEGTVEQAHAAVVEKANVVPSSFHPIAKKSYVTTEL